MTLSRWAPSARVPYAVLVVAVVLTVLGAYYVVRTGRIRDELHFQATTEEMRHLVQTRVHTYIEVMRATVALFGASDTVTAEEFRAFTAHLRLRERYPGIQGIGFAARIRRDDGPQPVWPRGERDEYTSIVFLEPLDERNQRAIGFDMFSEPVRRAAMERARDTGEPAASGKVTLVQEAKDDTAQAGFLIYAPVYRNGAPTTTIAERRAALVGYVYCPFRADDLLQATLGPGGLALPFTIYDGPTVNPANRMHVTAARRGWPSPHERLESTYALDVAGRPWTIVFTGERHFDGSSPAWIAPLVLVGGLLVSFALFAIVGWQYRARQDAEQHATELRASAAALRESETQLRRLVVLEREARAAAQAADLAKDEFLAMLSHELRTPLNAVLGWITILRAGKVREDRRADALAIIERNARSQAHLIEDLLDISRIVTGKVQLELRPVHLDAVVPAVMESLRPAADAKGVHIRVDIDPGLPHVHGDAPRLQQVLWNLVSNAIKFTPPGGHVGIEVKGTHSGVEVHVTDTGIGIEPDFLPHAFERFRQADSSTTRAHGGIGIGLAIVRHLVELHHGHVSAQSDGRDRGSQFVVWLPLAPAGMTAAAPDDRAVTAPTV